jgi:hypothetical protein
MDLVPISLEGHLAVRDGLGLSTRCGARWRRLLRGREQALSVRRPLWWGGVGALQVGRGARWRAGAVSEVMVVVVGVAYGGGVVRAGVGRR